MCKNIEKREIQSMSDASSFRPPLDTCMLERIDYIDEMSTDINHIRITEESANSKVIDGDMKGKLNKFIYLMHPEIDGVWLSDPLITNTFTVLNTPISHTNLSEYYL